MDADLARPPPPAPDSASAGTSRDSSGSRRRPTARTRPPTGSLAPLERAQLSEHANMTKWQEWDRYAVDLGCDWVVERDMDAFRQALSDEPTVQSPTDPSGPDQVPEKIIAASDWAPVKEPRRRRGGHATPPKKRKDVVREGWAYHISRWPLLGLIFSIIFLEFVAYLLVRQCVNLMEFFAGCPSPPPLCPS